MTLDQLGALSRRARALTSGLVEDQGQIAGYPVRTYTFSIFARRPRSVIRTVVAARTAMLRVRICIDTRAACWIECTDRLPLRALTFAIVVRVHRCPLGAHMFVLAVKKRGQATILAWFAFGDAITFAVTFSTLGYQALALTFARYERGTATEDGPLAFLRI